MDSMDKFSEIEKVVPAKEVVGSPGRTADVSLSFDTAVTIDPCYETNSQRRQGSSKSKETTPNRRSTNPEHAGWISDGRCVRRAE